MLTTYILISAFFVSLCIVVAMILYGMYKIDRGVEIEQADKMDDVHKVIFLYTKIISKKAFVEGIRTLRFIFILSSVKGKPVIIKIKKILLNQYNGFIDSVNGKDGVIEKGTASFFLKTVAMHKKKIKNKK